MSAVRVLQVSFLVSCFVHMIWVLVCFLEALGLKSADVHTPLYCRTSVGIGLFRSLALLHFMFRSLAESSLSPSSQVFVLEYVRICIESFVGYYFEV
mgnify:FL=1